MGEFNVIGLENPQSRRQFLADLLRDMRALDRMLAEDLFEADVRRMGAEQELVLVDDVFQPAAVNREVMERVADPQLTTELGRYNLELNMNPLLLEGSSLRRLEDDLNEKIGMLRAAAGELGVAILLVGVLPTLRLSDLTLEDMTPEERYYVLNERLTELHEGSYQVHIRGPQELILQHRSMMLEACTTSFQVHIQVSPDEFARLYNIAQAITGPVLSAAVNAPVALGKRLWQETRIALFQQAVDTRTGTLYHRESSPRVTFGTRWVDRSILEIFREDIARFRVLIGSRSDEDPQEGLKQGKIPRLHALQVFNSTVYRWNRPCYGITDGRPHLRIENRALPSGPTVVDEVANAAFWLGLVRGLAAAGIDVTDKMAFEEAQSNFLMAAEHGLDTRLHWFDGRQVAADELIRTELLPLARQGLTASDIDAGDIDRYLGIIEERVASGRTGAYWITKSLARLQEESFCSKKLNTLVSALLQRQQGGAPVHTWELAAPNDTTDNWVDFMRVEQCMSTDLFTVAEDEPIAFVASVMTWQHFHQLPVEDDEQRITGLITLSDIVNALLERDNEEDLTAVPVKEIMTSDPITVGPATSTFDALQLMRRHEIGCLPVITDDRRLVGILTEWDLMNLTAELMEQITEKQTDGARE